MASSLFWVGLHLLQRLSFRFLCFLFFFFCLWKIILHRTPTLMCFIKKERGKRNQTYPPAKWLPPSQTQESSNLFDFLSQLLSRWVLEDRTSDSGSTCWHTLGRLQWSRIYSYPLLCICSALSSKPSLVLCSVVVFWWIPLTTAARVCSSLVTPVGENPAFPYNYDLFNCSLHRLFPDLSFVLCKYIY